MKLYRTWAFRKQFYRRFAGHLSIREDAFFSGWEGGKETAGNGRTHLAAAVQRPSYAMLFLSAIKTAETGHERIPLQPRSKRTEKSSLFPIVPLANSRKLILKQAKASRTRLSCAKIRKNFAWRAPLPGFCKSRIKMPADGWFFGKEEKW